MAQVFNFSSGPAMLPADVLKLAQKDLCDWNGLGTSVMEVSHRGKEFIQVAQEAEQDFRDLLNIPSNYKVLFCHGGGRGQFSAIPLNILGDKTTADYVDAGYWAASAVKEAKKYCTPNVIDAKITVDGKRAVTPMSEWQLSDNAAYLHYCPNETIDGIAINETPNFGSDVVVTADFSSTILSGPLDVSRYGIIYAGAQKNIGPAGLTLVIVREDLLEGKPVVIIEDGELAWEKLNQSNMTEFEFFMELRLNGVEQLGQVRLAILETNGQISVYFFEDSEVKPGLSILPKYCTQRYKVVPEAGEYSCVRCSEVITMKAGDRQACPRCKNPEWSKASRAKRVV